MRAANYINGVWAPAASGQTFAVLDPGNGEIIGHVPDSGADDTIAAIAAAEKALPAWRARPAAARAQLLRRLFERMMDNVEPLARLLSRENGKPLAEARGEVRYGASFIEWFAAEARRVYGDQIPASTPDKRLQVSYEPVGVCALITQWNFPNAMITRKLGPALAAGCTVVIKPAEDTPFSTLAVAALCEAVGIPAGVVNVVCTNRPATVGQALCESPAVRKLSFTGSTEVGRTLMAQCAPTLKRLSLELGGSSPFIVFDDADLDKAAEGAIASKYRNNGQSCVASNRFIVHEDVCEAFAERVAARSRSLVVGYGLDAGSEIGPLINDAGKAKVARLVHDAITQGAVVHVGGAPADGAGLFWPPTVLSGIGPEMDIWSTEIFGPVLAIRTFTDEAEAIEMANETPFGLASYCYTENLSRSWRVREALDFGMVGINTGMISTAQAPFGGIKQSGMGREGSRYGILEYLQMKYTCIGV